MKNSDMSISREKISGLVYIPAIASLIPILGIPFGISAVLWGVSDWKIGGKRAVTIASIGFLISLFAVWYASSLYNWFEESPYLNQTKINYSQNGLAHLVRYLEYYKLGHGRYPDTLLELKEKDNSYMTDRTFTDPFSYSYLVPTGGAAEQHYYYMVYDNGSSYDLFSVGPDKTPFTVDDIYPVVLDEYRAALGLRTKGNQSP